MKDDTIIQKLEDYVLKLEFNLRVGPLEKILYTTVSVILMTVLGALMVLVIKK